MIAKFTPYSGYLMGLPTNDDHLVFRWNNPDCKVLFSVTRLGDVASCHFASDKAGLRSLAKAIDEFVLYVFCLLDWCTMVIAQTTRPSVGRLIRKCGFVEAGVINDITVFERLR